MQRWHSGKYQWGLTIWKRKAHFKRVHGAVDNWTVWQSKTRENRPEVLHIFYQCSGNITASSITSEELLVHSWNNNIYSIFEENILFLNRSEWELEEMQLKNVASADKKNNRENQLITPPWHFLCITVSKRWLPEKVFRKNHPSPTFPASPSPLYS